MKQLVFSGHAEIADLKVAVAESPEGKQAEPRDLQNNLINVLQAGIKPVDIKETRELWGIVGQLADETDPIFSEEDYSVIRAGWEKGIVTFQLGSKWGILIDTIVMNPVTPTDKEVETA